MLTALIPVKALADGKRRLAPDLGPIERRLLVLAMLEDVVAAVQAVPGLERPVVVSPDREIWRRADALGCRVVEEPPGAAGLNAALRRAAAELRLAGAPQGGGEMRPAGEPAHAAELRPAGGPKAAGKGRAGGLLVVAADLPLASPAELRTVMDAAGTAPVVVVTNVDGTGTNVLAWQDPATFAPAFGPDSAAAHLAHPGALRVEAPGLGLDVDTVADLAAVASRVDPASVTARRLRDLRLAGRLAPR